MAVESIIRREKAHVVYHVAVCIENFSLVVGTGCSRWALSPKRASRMGLQVARKPKTVTDLRCEYTCMDIMMHHELRLELSNSLAIHLKEIPRMLLNCEVGLGGRHELGTGTSFRGDDFFWRFKRVLWTIVSFTRNANHKTPLTAAAMSSEYISMALALRTLKPANVRLIVQSASG